MCVCSFLAPFYLHYADGLFLWYFVDNFQHLKCYLTSGNGLRMKRRRVRMRSRWRATECMVFLKSKSEKKRMSLTTTMHSTVNFHAIFGITFYSHLIMANTSINSVPTNRTNAWPDRHPFSAVQQMRGSCGATTFNVWNNAKIFPIWWTTRLVKFEMKIRMRSTNVTSIVVYVACFRDEYILRTVDRIFGF